ncbi:MAG: amidohydrolase family protein [Balneolia bacterium]|nr:amidohydrolase family protein [Balneolia bacterium]
MKTLLYLLFLLLLINTQSTAEAQSNSALVLDGVHVLTMESEEILRNQTILIEDGIISAMGEQGTVSFPDGAEVIEGPFYVMPGMAEMHAHIPPERQGEAYMLQTLALYLSQGITTIRGMLGEPAHLDLRDRAANGEIVSPRIFTSGPSFSGTSVTSLERARNMVMEQADAGYDLLKFHPGLTVEKFEVIVEAAAEAEIEFSGHISHAVGLERSLAAGKGTIDHLDRYMEFLSGNPEDREDPSIIYFGYDLAYDADESLISEAVRLTREAGVWNVPTNTLMHNVFNPDLTTDIMREWPGMEYMPEQLVNNWARFVNELRQGDDYDEEKARRFLELRDTLTLALHDGGAGLLLGADAPQIFNPPGYSAHRELRLLVDAGLTPFEALQTGTTNVGVYLNEEELTGKVSSGFLADLVLTESNPLESIPFHDKILGVVASGVYFSTDELKEIIQPGE